MFHSTAGIFLFLVRSTTILAHIRDEVSNLDDGEQSFDFSV